MDNKMSICEEYGAFKAVILKSPFTSSLSFFLTQFSLETKQKGI